MRIGFFADEYLPRLDGVITSMLNSAKGLERLGHEVYFVVPAYPSAKSESRVIRVPSTPVPLSDNVRIMLPGPALKRKLRGLRLDVIHSHTPFAAAQVARRAASDLSLPHITTFHTLLPVLLDYYPLRTRGYFPAVAASIADILYASDLNKYTFPASDKKSSFKRQAWKWTGAFIDSVDHVITPSKHFADKLRLLGADTPISLLPNSLDLGEFNQHRYHVHKPLRLIAVGRLSPEKRQYELIQALSHIKQDEVVLTLVGDGPDRKHLTVLISELELDNVVMTGALPPKRVKDMLALQDVGVLASHGFDNQPMTILEYLASGLPVLYCDPELTEGLNSRNSYLSKPQPAKLAESIKRLKGLKLNAMSKAAQAASQQFDMVSLAAQLEKVYKGLIRG